MATPTPAAEHLPRRGSLLHRSSVVSEFLLALAGLLLAAPLLAQSDPQGSAEELAVVYGAEVGEPVTPFVFDGDLRDLPIAPQWKPGDPVREVPRRVYPAPGLQPPFAATQAPQRDPLVGVQNSVPEPDAPSAFTAPIVNVSGMGYSGVSPPDTVGDIGPNHYIQAINDAVVTYFRVHAKDGTVLSGPTAMGSLAPPGSPCQANALGDPIVLYDRLADRWLIQEFTSTDDLCVYISQGPNPITGGWYVYQFPQAIFPDYPHLGVWPDAYYVTTNESPGGAPLYAFDRANMLIGAAARPQQRFTVPKLGGYSFQALTPADFDGPTAPPAGAPGIFMRHNDDEAHLGGPNPANDFIDMYTLAVNWTTPASSALTTLPKITIAEFNSWLNGYTTFAAVPQPGTNQRIDPIREIVMQSLQYRNFTTYQTLVGNFVTNIAPAVSGSVVNTGVRWFELRKAGAGAWTLFQEGTFAPGDPSTNRWMAGISTDQSGNIAFGYSITKTSVPVIYPSLRYTGRLATDALGIMTQGETSFMTGTSSNSNSRWGDYAAMGVDPSDGCTFWYTNEYMSGNWATRIASFKFDACGCLVAALATAAAPNRIDVTWNDSATASITLYYVRRSTTAGGPYTQIATVADSSPGVGGGPPYSYQDTTVSGGTTYYYTVLSNGGGDCPANPANEASALATGLCTLAPNFAGLTSVTTPGSATCTLNLTWSAATSNCAAALSYNVYRSTLSGFVPAPANRIATGIAGTSYSDSVGVVYGTTYYYVVRAVDAAASSEDTNLVQRDDTPSGPFTNGSWSDDAGDTGAAKLILAAPWSVALTGGRTAPRVYQTGAYTDNLCAALTTPRLRLGTGAVLSFGSKYDIETDTDAGIVEIATAPTYANWTKLPVTTYPNDLANTGNACGFPSSGANTVFSRNDNTPAYPALYTSALSGYNGQQVQLRWNFSSDGSGTRAGWWIDDITVTNIQVPSSCTTGAALPKPVPDGNYVPGTPLRGTRSGATIDTTWDSAACGSSNYNLYRGTIGDFTAVAGGSCAIGTSGSATGIVMPADSWWIIAGTNGSQVSSFGRVTGGAERALTGFAAACPAQTAQNTTASCP